MIYLTEGLNPNRLPKSINLSPLRRNRPYSVSTMIGE